MRIPFQTVKSRTAMVAFCLGVVMGSTLWAADEISRPSAAVPTQEAAQGSSSTVPAESEKGPSAVKPSAKPLFTLPEVVITGDNQLTIGAKRLERHEDDVTRGSKELRGLSRSENDLPGLENQRTGLSALSPEAARNTVAILHGGVGHPRAWEGWGLLGTRFKGFQALLSAEGDQIGGVEVNGVKTRRSTLGWGAVLQAEPTEKLLLRLSRDYEGERNDLPFQTGQEERRWSVTEGSLVYRLAPAWKVEAKGLYWDTTLTPGNPTIGDTHAVEREGRARVQWDMNGGWLESLWASAGGRTVNGHFEGPALDRYDAVWGRLGLKLQPLARTSLAFSFGATRLGGVGLKTKGEPKVELEFLPGEKTRVCLHAKAERTLNLFQTTQGTATYTLPGAGFSAPGFVRQEVGIEADRRLTGRITLSVGARGWDEEGHPQWTEWTLVSHRPVWNTLGLFRCWEIRSGVRADLTGGWGLSAEGRLSAAEDRSHLGRKVTAWPRALGSASLFRKTPKSYLALTAKGVASREASEMGDVELPPYWTLGLEARRALTGNLSVWGKGENLNGQHYELLPGYPEPRFLALAGLEIVL